MQEKETLVYYQQKLDGLNQQKLTWLAKFQECAEKLHEKHAKAQALKINENKEADIHRSIVHHQIALLDQQLNVLRIHRETQQHQFKDAEQILQINAVELDAANKQPSKHIKCLPLSSAGLIQNEFNIHAASNNFKFKTPSAASNIIKQNNNDYSFQEKQQNSANTQQIKSVEELLRQHIIDVKASNQSELVLMQEQIKRLQRLLKEQHQRESIKQTKEAMIVQQIKQKAKIVDKKYKTIADKYFKVKSDIKQQAQQRIRQRNQLENAGKVLNEKVSRASEKHQKQTLAKQKLIQHKSEDFQQDYKAKMRARERTLQSHRDNYQSMQQECIKQLQTLENTLHEAKHKLKEVQTRKHFLVTQLRTKLNALEIKVGAQTKEKRKAQEVIRQRALQQKQAKQIQQLAQMKKIAKNNNNIKKSYERKQKLIKTIKRKAVKKHKQHKSINKDNHNQKQKLNNGEQSQDFEQDSLQISDLQNIRKQITRLEDKICHEAK